jgi:phosphate transport system substrate-binding protein
VFKRSRYLVILIATFISVVWPLSACKPQPVTKANDSFKGTITISGAFALYPMMQRWAEEFHAIHPEVEFDISAGGAGKGMTDVLSDAVDIGMISRDIVDEEISKGAYGIAVTKDAVFPTVNEQNPIIQDLLTQGIDQETFIKIYITGQITNWGQVIGRSDVLDEIHIYTRSDSCGAGEIWAKFLGNNKQEDLLGIGVSGDPGVVQAVAQDPLGIGYNNLNYAFDITTGNPVTGITVAPIDININHLADSDEIFHINAEAISAVASGKYPSPPSRLLYLATHGKPTGLTQSFIEWILIDGQDLLSESGYIQLTLDQLDLSLNRVR